MWPNVLFIIDQILIEKKIATSKFNQPKSALNFEYTQKKKQTLNRTERAGKRKACQSVCLWLQCVGGNNHRIKNAKTSRNGSDFFLHTRNMRQNIFAIVTTANISNITETVKTLTMIISLHTHTWLVCIIEKRLDQMMTPTKTRSMKRRATIVLIPCLQPIGQVSTCIPSIFSCVCVKGSKCFRKDSASKTTNIILIVVILNSYSSAIHNESRGKERPIATNCCHYSVSEMPTKRGEELLAESMRADDISECDYRHLIAGWISRFFVLLFFLARPLLLLVVCHDHLQDYLLLHLVRILLQCLSWQTHTTHTKKLFSSPFCSIKRIQTKSNLLNWPSVKHTVAAATSSSVFFSPFQKSPVCVGKKKSQKQRPIERKKWRTKRKREEDWRDLVEKEATNRSKGRNPIQVQKYTNRQTDRQTGIQKGLKETKSKCLQSISPSTNKQIQRWNPKRGTGHWTLDETNQSNQSMNERWNPID